MNRIDSLESQMKLLKKRERFYIVSLICLFLVIIWLAGHSGHKYYKEKREKINDLLAQEKKKEEVPYFKEVQQIIKNLQYSGLSMLEREDVTLRLDFKNSSWALEDLHKFDQSGDIILEEGKYGTCGELAAYTYKHIQPILGNKYKIKFVKAAQSGFFLSARDSHVVLHIEEKGMYPKGKGEYIIDPSFCKYGPIYEFEDYLFLDYLDYLPFMEDKQTEVKMSIHSAIPILIKGDYLLGFSVESNDGVYDPQNFVIAIVITKRYCFSCRYLYAIRNNNGIAEKFENTMLAKQLLSENEYKRLVDKVMFLFEEVKISNLDK